MAKSHKLQVVVGTTDCDALGHLNVARYFELCNLCGSDLLVKIGWVPGAERDGLRLSFAVVRLESDFRSEVMEGETLIVHSEVVRIGTKSATFRNRITREDNSPVFSSEWTSACLNLDTRRSHVIPDALRADLQTYLATE